MYIIPYNIKQGIIPSIKPSEPSRLVGRFIETIVIEGGVSLTTSCYSYVTVVTPAPRNPALDITINDDVNYEVGVLKVEIFGESISLNINAEALNVIVDILGSIRVGLVFGELLSLSITIRPDEAYISVVVPKKANWVKWSDIGSLNFTISKSNVAGERPLDWKGFVYHLKKLKSKVVAYGQGGVSFLIPVDNVYSLQTIYRVGVKNKGAVAGNEDIHFFVDSLNQLWKLDQDLERLDYSEYISNMTDSIILSYDIENRLLYICDGVIGYVYGVDTKSFGLGPANITGIGSPYFVSSDNIEIPLFEICTDTYDFGTRKSKTIQSVEVGSNLTNHLYVSVDYRTNHQSDFKQISWFLVNPDGKAYPKCYGVEFRFRIKSLTYEQFKLDYIRVKGYINDLRDKTI